MDSLANVAALVNMANAGAQNGHDQEGMHFLQVARSMAERLGLDDDTKPPAFLLRKLVPKPLTNDRRFHSHVAWGYFIMVKYVIQRSSNTVGNLLNQPACMLFTTVCLQQEDPATFQSQGRISSLCLATWAQA